MAQKSIINCEPIEDGRQSDGGTVFKIQIHQIVEYFLMTVRPLREGENLVDAGWIYSIGTVGRNKKKVLGNVFQTTHMSERPHEVVLENLELEASKWKCVCSCKAGIGEKCKHIAACLIYIQKNPCLFELSPTQLQQKWGKIGKEMASAHGGVKIKNMCHVLEKINVNKDEVVSLEAANKILQIGLEAFPDSEYGRLKRCYRSTYVAQQQPIQSEEEIKICNEMNDFYELLFKEDDFVKKFLPEMQKYLAINDKIKKKFDQNIGKRKEEAIMICKETITQSSFAWLQERKSRITASISYGLFTYSKNKNPDWPKKIQSTFSNRFKGNEATRSFVLFYYFLVYCCENLYGFLLRYGKQSENEAKEEYRKLYLLFDCGIIISPTLPLFAVSPDGLSYNGEEWKLVEIKSPVMGKCKSSRNLLADLKYLRTDDGFEYHLREKHEYYGQIQLGLFVLGLENCDFVIYSSYIKSNIVIINVKKDYEFLENYINTLISIYFKYIYC